MPRDHDAGMENLVVLEQVADYDRGTRVAHRHRIATAADGHEGIGGHHAVPRALVPVGRPRPQGRELLLFGARKAGGRGLMRRAMHPGVGHGRRPLEEPVVQVRPRGEAFPHERVVLDVLHAGFGLPLRLGPVGPVGPRPEAVVGGEVGIGRVPHHVVAPGRAIRPVVHHRSPRVIQHDLLRDAAKMLEGLLVPGEHGVCRRPAARGETPSGIAAARSPA